MLRAGEVLRLVRGEGNITLLVVGEQARPVFRFAKFREDPVFIQVGPVFILKVVSGEKKGG